MVVRSGSKGNCAGVEHAEFAALDKNDRQRVARPRAPDPECQGFRVTYERTLHVLMLIVAFVPFFAFGEIGRVLGAHKPAAMFLFEREAPGEDRRPASRPSLGGG